MHCAEKIVFAHLRAGSVCGTGGAGWGHPQGAVHMAAARLGYKRTMVGTGWANSWPGHTNRCRVLCTWQLLGLVVKEPWLSTGWANSWPGYMSRLRKHYPHLSGGSFLAENAS